MYSLMTVEHFSRIGFYLLFLSVWILYGNLSSIFLGWSLWFGKCKSVWSHTHWYGSIWRGYSIYSECQQMVILVFSWHSDSTCRWFWIHGLVYYTDICICRLDIALSLKLTIEWDYHQIIHITGHNKALTGIIAVNGITSVLTRLWYYEVWLWQTHSLF